MFGRLAGRLPPRPRRFVQRCHHTVRVLSSLRGIFARECPLCGYRGKFRAEGLPPELDELCPKCGSLSRHRLFHLADERHGILEGVRSLLHFAPEDTFRSGFAARFPQYRTADVSRRDVDHRVDMEDTGLPEAGFDAVFASHVLEHVGDDRKAIAEIARILRPGGVLVAMVPLIDAWADTYEDPLIVTERARELHFGQSDHVRLYGRDFEDRLGVHFQVTSHMASPADCVRYSLVRGERVFVARKAGR
jgi:SAM-dependent methyltransferase